MKTLKSAISLLLLSSTSAIAAETVPSSNPSSLPLIATAAYDTKPAVDGVNGKVQMYGGAGQDNSVSISSFPRLAPRGVPNSTWNGWRYRHGLGAAQSFDWRPA
jgi:hypothetical protein